MTTSATPPMFSLIVGTKGRSGELRQFLASLCQQSSSNFEVIIVDQNQDDRLVPVIAAFTDLQIIHHRVGFTGLSRARNAGLILARGEVVAFPDDDCLFPPSTLETAGQLLQSAPEIDGVSGRLETPSGGSSHLRSGSRARNLNRVNVWDLALSATIFLRRQLVNAVGEFDEELGVGSGTAWGSGEETDYLLRALSLGFRLRYQPSLVVWHPPPPGVHTEAALSRGLLYGAGLGRVLRKNHAPAWLAALMLLRALAGTFAGAALLRPGMARFHFNVLRGRWRGWRCTA